MEVLGNGLTAVAQAKGDVVVSRLGGGSTEASSLEFEALRELSSGHFPAVVAVGHAGKIIIHLLPCHDARIRSYAELERGGKLCGGVDSEPALAVAQELLSAVLDYDLCRKLGGPVDKVLNGSVRHIVAGHIDVTVIERLGPMRELLRHRPCGRDT